MNPAPLQRRFERLLEGPFDLLVVGGGIFGAWAAYDGAARGLRVAIVEQQDWAAGSSSASSKLLHGRRFLHERSERRGLRGALAERQRLATIAPHCVRPIRVASPTRAEAAGKLRLKADLWLHDRQGGSRPPAAPYANLTRDAFAQRYGFLTPERLRGGFRYSDFRFDDARLTLEVVAAAIHFGAVAVNRARVRKLLSDNRGKVVGAEVLDRETEATVRVTAAMTLNCTGPWLDRLEGAPPQTTSSASAPRIKGVHVVVPTLGTDDAILLPTAGGKSLYLLPWFGRTLLGATGTPFKGTPGFARAEPRDVAYLLNEANRHLATPWEQSDVVATFAGLRSDENWRLEEPADGLGVSVGGDYTSARADMAQALDRTLQRLARPPVDGFTATRPLPFAPDEPYEEFRAGAISRGLAVGLDESMGSLAASRYGKRVRLLLETLAEQPALAARIVPGGPPLCLADVVVATRFEMARSLTDVLRRRLPIAFLTRLDEPTVRRCATLAGDVLNWSPARRETEVETILHPSRGLDSLP